MLCSSGQVSITSFWRSTRETRGLSLVLSASRALSDAQHCCIPLSPLPGALSGKKTVPKSDEHGAAMQKSVKQTNKSPSPPIRDFFSIPKDCTTVPSGPAPQFFMVNKSDALSLLGRGGGCWQMGARCHLLPSLPTAPTHSGRTGLGNKP